MSTITVELLHQSSRMFPLDDASNPPPANVSVVLWIEYLDHVQEYEGEGEYVIGVQRHGVWEYLSYYPGRPSRWGKIPRARTAAGASLQCLAPRPSEDAEQEEGRVELPPMLRKRP